MFWTGARCLPTRDINYGFGFTNTHIGQALQSLSGRKKGGLKEKVTDQPLYPEGIVRPRFLPCSFNFALGVKIIMSIVRSTQKNFALGTYNLFGHLLGDGISGYMLGFVSDALANKESVGGGSKGSRGYHCADADEGDDESSQGTFETIRLSLYILVVVSVIGFFSFRVASQHYDEDEKRASRSIQETKT